MSSNHYCVIVKYGNEIVGDKRGIPCRDLAHAYTLARQYNARPNLTASVEPQVSSLNKE